MTEDQERDGTWQDYYEAVQGREPRPLFLDALAQYGGIDAAEMHAIDLGCGDGTETLALLRAGWNVLAIDSEPAALEHVRDKAGAALQPRLQTTLASFEDVELLEAEFIYAGYSLPFCRPGSFDRLWDEISNSLRRGGRFAGQLFGVRDTWADEPDMTFHTANQVDRLLAQHFEIESLEEIDEDGEAVSGPKHWHVFDIIAKRFPE